MYNRTDKNIVSQKNKKNKGQPIYSEKDHRVIAYLFGDELHKHTKKIMYNPPAIATEIEALRKGEQAGAKICIVTNKSNGLIYKAPIEKIWRKGFVVNFGFGDQQALALEEWLQTRDPEYAEPTHTRTPEYTEPSGTTDIMTLKYHSNAPTGVTVNGVKQLGFFDKGGE